MLFGIFICWTTMQSLKIIIERQNSSSHGESYLLVQLSEMPVTRASPGVETKRAVVGERNYDRFLLSILS